MTTNSVPFPLILGHRGAPRMAPENTLASFDRALRAGADGVELDVRRSRDGVPVVMHDDDLRRTMGAAGRVSELGWPAIQRLTNGQVPSLEQAVAWAAAAEAWINVEIKSKGVEQSVADIVGSAKLQSRTIISSFDPVIVATIGSIRPELRRFLLTKQWDSATRQDFEVSGAEGLCLHVDAATDEVMRRLGGEQVPVIVWTVNDAARVARLLELGAVGIISDEPGSAATVRDRKP